MTDDIAFFNWVEEHRTDNPSTLRLKYGNKKEPIDYADAILQIECRKKFGKKLADTLAAFLDFTSRRHLPENNPPPIVWQSITLRSCRKA